MFLVVFGCYGILNTTRNLSFADQKSTIGYDNRCKNIIHIIGVVISNIEFQNSSAIMYIIKKKKTTINARVINENVARFLSSSCFINTLL